MKPLSQHIDQIYKGYVMIVATRNSPGVAAQQDGRRRRQRRSEDRALLNPHRPRGATPCARQHPTAKANDKASRLTIDNDLTIYNAPEHKRLLLDALDQASVVELDLARVGEIDSAGLQVLLLAKRECLAGGKDLRIVAHSPAVQELLDFFNLAALLRRSAGDFGHATAPEEHGHGRDRRRIRPGSARAAGRHGEAA